MLFSSRPAPRRAGPIFTLFLCLCAGTALSEAIAQQSDALDEAFLAAAKQRLTSQIQANPRAADAHYLLAETLLKQGDTTGAYREFAMALQVLPDGPNRLNAEWQVKELEGFVSEADRNVPDITQMTAMTVATPVAAPAPAVTPPAAPTPATPAPTPAAVSTSLSPELQVELELARAYINMKRFDDAQKNLLNIISANPDQIDALFLLGELHFSNGNFPAAMAYYQLAGKAPGNPSLQQ